MAPRILFVFTSADTALDGAPTGWYLPEAAHPYYELAPHYEIDFAAPKGANPPVDKGSVEMFKDDELSANFLKDATVTAKLASAKKLSEVKAADYDAVFYPGGHGPVIDLAQDPDNAKLASEFYRAGKVTSAVCHGPAALAGATDASGKSIFVGQIFTGFSVAEEEAIGKTKAVPFLLENRFTELGGKYEKAAEPWAPHVVVSGHLLTGQNPASSGPLGKAIHKALSSK